MKRACNSPGPVISIKKRGAWKNPAEAKRELFRIKENLQQQMKDFEEKFCVQPTLQSLVGNDSDVEDALITDSQRCDIGPLLEETQQITEDALLKFAMVYYFESNFVFLGTYTATQDPTDNTHAVTRSQLRTVLSDFLVRTRLLALGNKSPAWKWFMRDYLKLSKADIASRKKLHLSVILTKAAAIETLDRLKAHLIE